MENISRKSTYSLLAMDLDGTLVDSQKKISDRNKKAVHEAAAKGVAVAFKLLVAGLIDAQAIYLQKAFQAAYDEIAAVSITPSKVARVHHAVVFVTFQ